MGAHFWSYIVPYQDDIQSVLEELREREFLAGRFWQPDEIPPGRVGRILGRPAVPPNPRNIDEAIKFAAETGTRSILDMEKVSETPGFGAVSPIPPEVLIRLFGTEQPALEQIEQSDELLDMLERGQGIYIVLYSHLGKPGRIYFAGYSYD